MNFLETKIEWILKSLYWNKYIIKWLRNLVIVIQDRTLYLSKSQMPWSQVTSKGNPQVNGTYKILFRKGHQWLS